MHDEERQAEFEGFPLDSQIRIHQTQSNLYALTENMGEASQRSQTFDALLECARNTNDINLLRGILYEGAEYFSNLRPLPPDGHEYDIQRAYVLDWLRHVLEDKPKCGEYAVAAMESCITGDFLTADFVFASCIDSHKDEYEAIKAYWRVALGF